MVAGVCVVWALRKERSDKNDLRERQQAERTADRDEQPNGTTGRKAEKETAAVTDRSGTASPKRDDGAVDPSNKETADQPQPKVDAKADGFPVIAGLWRGGPEENPVQITIVQDGEKVTADCTYQHKETGTVHWEMKGTITKDGKIRGGLVDTTLKHYYGEVQTAVLSSDGKIIKGRVRYVRGGSHDFVWNLISRPPTKDESHGDDNPSQRRR
jgi:hypothetical protein